MDHPTFSFGQRIGLLFTVQGASLSIFAVTAILFYSLYKWFRTSRNPDSTNLEVIDSILFRNLMLAELIQAIPATFNVKWMNDAHITVGNLCMAQAVLKQIGIVGVAVTSFAIAVYSCLFLNVRKMSEYTAQGIVLGIWIFTALVVGIPNIVNKNDRYYGPTDFWCWILPVHRTEQIVSEYLWTWIAALSMLLLYPIMVFILNREIKKLGNRNSHSVEMYAPNSTLNNPQRRTDGATIVAMQMLLYPLVYIVCTLPNCVARWLYFTGHPISSKVTLGFNSLYALSGFFNVVLFFFTRRLWVVGGGGGGGNSERLQQSSNLSGIRSPPFAAQPLSSSSIVQSPSSSSAVMRDDHVASPSTYFSPQSHGSRSFHERPAPSGGRLEEYGRYSPAR